MGKEAALSDPLAPLMDLDGVDAAVTSARAAIDEAHKHPRNRRGWAATAAEASVRAARASAATDGGSVDIPDEGTVNDPILAGALRVAESLGPLLPTWQRAPLQTLARLHVLAAADLVSDADELGRPFLREDGSRRLDMLAELVTGATSVPAPVLAAIVHGELLALAPFGHANGVVARAATRLTMIGSGLDAKGLVVPEVAFLRAGGRYPKLALGFAEGTEDGVREWLLFCCQALVSGANEARSIADAAVAE